MKHTLLLQHLEKLMSIEPAARLGSLKAAAEELNISQPSLSFKVSQLEEILEIELFERVPRGVIPTNKGHQVISFVKEVSRLAYELEELLANDETEFEGIIKVGLYDSIARYFWPSFFKEFKLNHPNLKIETVTGRSSELLRLLSDRQIDLCFSVDPYPVKGIQSIDLFQDSFSFYINKTLIGNKNQRNQTVKISYSEMAAIDLITFQGASTFTLNKVLRDLKYVEALSAQNHSVESFEVALEFCRQGMGVAILPNKVAEKDFSQGNLLKLDLKSINTIDFGKHMICLSTLESHQNRGAINAFTESVIERTYI